MRRAIVFAATILSGCADYQLLTPSELNAHAEQYDGKEVQVRGWLVYKFEDIGLWDSKAAHDRPHDGGDQAVSLALSGRGSVWPASCISIPDFNSSKHLSEPVIIDGIFPKAYLASRCVLERNLQ